MSPVSENASGLKELARRVVAHEALLGGSVSAEGSAQFRVCEKLRGPLSKCLGAGGFSALLSRALALAGAELPWLGGLQIKGDGSLDGLDHAAPGGEDATRGERVLVAHLLGLLVTFIGPALTRRLLQDIWPKLEDLEFPS